VKDLLHHLTRHSYNHYFSTPIQPFCSTLIATALLATLWTASISAQESSAQTALSTTSPGQLENRSNQLGPLSIIVDDRREGWEHAIASNNDTPGDNGSPGQIDWKTITLAHDCDDLFVRYEVTDGQPFVPDGFRYNLLVDTDRNPLTGYRGANNQLAIGADLLIQGGQGKVTTYTFTNETDQQAWSWQAIHFYPVNDTATVTGGRDIEYRIRLLDLATLGHRVDSFNWVAWADNSAGTSDYYPDGGSLGGGGYFNTYTLNYTPITDGLANPERGFFESTQTQSSNYESVDLATLKCFRQSEGTTLVHRLFYLENFINSDISQSYLELMQADFDNIRQAGLKVIPRFAYSASAAGPGLTPPYGDASKERILSHLSQLSSTLKGNSDVIALMQAGFIGLWGEWWFSDYFQPDASWNDKADVLFGILDALPATRAVQLRAPRYKQNMFSDFTPLDQTSAHDGSYRARTGHHNDCFLSSASDGGTYLNAADEYPYLEQETKWTPMGGETCSPNYLSDPAPSRLECTTALNEMTRFHWSYLNLDWYKPTLQKWQENGCYQEINQRLGYQLAIIQSQYDEQVVPGSAFNYRLELTNDGFAAPFNPRAVELVLRHTDGAIHRFSLPDNPKLWLPGQLHLISGEILIPENFPQGEYQLLLNLPDPEPQLNQRPEYSIQLANDNVWEAETGYNKLNHTLIVSPPPPSIYHPNTIEIIRGHYDWGTQASFTASDNDTYDILGRQVRRGRVTDWIASTTLSAIPTEQISQLTLTYEGQYSRKKVRQKIYIYNFTHSTWDRVDARTVGNRDDVKVQVTLPSPQAYLSPTGETRVRVRGFRNSWRRFFSWSNVLSWEIQ